MNTLKLSLLVGVLMLSAQSLAEDDAMILVDIQSATSSAELAPVDGIRSSGQPDAEAFSLIADAGYVAVLDLRGASENRGLDEAAILDQLDLEYLTLPLTSPEAINFENADKLEKLLADADGPVLLHCGSGNRVGALLALMKSRQGLSDQAALEYGRSAGLTGLEPVVRARLSQSEDD